MKVALILSTSDFREMSQKYIDIMKANNIEFLIIDFKINSLDFALDNILQCTHVIFRYAHCDEDQQLVDALLNAIEISKKKVFPNFNTRWHYDNKISEYSLLKLLQFDSIKTDVYFSFDSIVKDIEKLSFPIVWKLKRGASSNTVQLIKTKKDLLSISKILFNVGFSPISSFLHFEENKLKQYLRVVYYYLFNKFPDYLTQNWNEEKNYVLLQEFMPDNDYDTRITIIGNKAFAFRRFNRDDDFRASGSGKINYEQDKIDQKMIEMAFDCSQKFGFQSMAYDFLYDVNKVPKICEISYTYQSKAIYNCPGYWTDKFEFINGNFWPEQFHLEDLLEIPIGYGYSE